jgi:ribose 5-phosphate isomerase B
MDGDGTSATGEVFISSDHRGFNAKNALVASLNDEYTVTDLGPFELNPDDDYNDAAIAVAKAVKSYNGAKGIIICGSGHGVCIQANRFKGIRAIDGFTEELARLGREHNDANILCLSADFLSEDQMTTIARIFLNTTFSDEERHIRRINRLDEEV